MNNNEFYDLLSQCRVSQIGMFVRDVYACMDNWASVHNVSDWTLFEHTNERLTKIVRRENMCEEKFKFYAGCAMLGTMQIEVIQPLYGLPFYEKFFTEHGQSIHHFKIVVAEERYDEVLEHYASLGMEVLFGAEYFGSKFYFIDSLEQLGGYLEIGNGRFPEGAPPEWAIPYKGR